MQDVDGPDAVDVTQVDDIAATAEVGPEPDVGATDGTSGVEDGRSADVGTDGADGEDSGDGDATASDSGPDDSHVAVDDAVEPSDASEDSVSDTSTPRCPGGAVVFEWGPNGQTIEVDDVVTVSEYLGEERRSREYNCPDDFFGAASEEPRWRSPVVVSWYQPLGTSSSWRDFTAAFTSAASLWDFLTQNGEANPDNSRLPSGTLRVTSSTGATRAIPLSFIRPRPLQTYPSETPPSERLGFEANESPEHGFTLDIIGVGQNIRAQYISVRVDPDATFSPEIRYPGQWDNAWYSRAAGQLRIYNGCDTAGARAFFGRRDVWTWYASGRNEKKNLSIRFIGPNGQEERRLNAYNALPTAYGPGFDDCTSEEVIVLGFELIENG